jgi:uncharacterized protein
MAGATAHSKGSTGRCLPAAACARYVAGTVSRAVTAQDLYNYTRCPHRVYLDTHGDPAERSEASPFVELLWEMGLQTEREYLGTLGEATVEDLSGLALEEAEARTRALMAQGARLVYQGVIRAGRHLGRPDLLVRRDEAGSDLGPYHYEAVDIKAGRGWEHREGARPRFKTHYAFQILFYREILARVQGYAPPVGRIVNADKEIETFDPADFEAAFHDALAAVERLVDGVESSEPVLGSHCHLCHWYRRCRRWVEAKEDPSGIYFVGQVKFDLKRAGLATVADIAAMDVARYLTGPNKIPRLGEKSLRRMKERAQVLLEGRPRLGPGYRLPAATREIYFDIEDDPTRNHVYLYGLLVVEPGGGEGDYRFFLAAQPEEEARAAREFWAFLAANEDVVYYVYSPKERATLRRLMGKYDLDETVFARYVEREYDLYTELVVKYSDWPTYSYGIKQIARVIGFAWRDPDPGGANSIAWYNAYLADPAREDLLRRLLEYNEDDCRAMLAVKRYFERAATDLT